MEAKFSFFKAGQGSFYGGRIFSYENGKVYTIVYDCGTSPFISGNSQSLNQEIDFFKYSKAYYPHTDEIDLLFISHLDYDHVSGLRQILTRYQVKNIILPYIEKQQRQFFIISIGTDNKPDDLSIDDYSEFLETPHTYIRETSKNKEIQLYFVVPNDKEDILYEGYGNGDVPTEVYPMGNPYTGQNEFIDEEGVLVYENNLQFFIQRQWEFTTYVKSVNKIAISSLKNCLKIIVNKKQDEILDGEDLKKLITQYRKQAHKCYTDCIGEINSHGLVLLHGPINFEFLVSKIYPQCELNYFKISSHFRQQILERHPKKRKLTMMGTLLFGDTSINPSNNPISFPKDFKAKLGRVHVIQVPHHGSQKNWDFINFKNLKIGEDLDKYEIHTTTVCNFGYGNKYGHPSNDVVNDLSSTLFLNTQFSRLNIVYEEIYS